MNRSLSKELRPLLLPWCVAAAGGLVPPDDDVTGVFGALLNFGGFAVLAAMVFAIEFQERTLPLLLSQPVERYRVWMDKLKAVALATAGLVVLNWRTHLFLHGLAALGSLFGWGVLVGTLCSAGFWIMATRSVLRGMLLGFLMQLIVCAGTLVAVEKVLGPTFQAGRDDYLRVLAVAAVIYWAAWVWLSRGFLKTRLVFKIGAAFLLVALFAVGEILIDRAFEPSNYRVEFWLAGAFLLATIGSVGWWTMVARTVLGGAVLASACQALCLLAVLFILSQISGTDDWFEGGRLMMVVVLGTPLYSALFLQAGWRRFSRLEVKEPIGQEAAIRAKFPKLGQLGSGWLRCREGESWLNLARKELCLQKPLLLLAAVFCSCWLGFLVLHWLQPHRVAAIHDVLVCLYAPLSVALAGCISLGEEKTLGLAGWNLAQPVSAAQQWLMKLVVGGLVGLVLGLILPLSLTWIAGQFTDAGLLMKGDDHGWLALAGISGGLFILSFWAATLVPKTIWAPLTAVSALIPLFFCGIFGSWCARETCGFPPIAFGSDGKSVVVPDVSGVLGFIVIFAGIALLQSLAQFRRIRIPSSTVVIHTLLLGLGVIAGSFWWTAVLIAAGR